MTKNFLLLIGCFFLFSCAKQTPIASQNKNLFLENMSNVKNDHLYQHADHIKEFVFPRDHGAHNEFKTEWWYFTGNLSALKQKNDFGFQFTIFRNNIAPESKALNDWDIKNIFMGHLGLTDVANKQFYSFEKFERQAIDLAGITMQPYKIWLNHWYIKSLSKSKDIFPLEIFAMENGIGYQLVLEPLKDFVLQGDKGLSQKSAKKGNASYYYSFTRLKTSGKVFIEGTSYQVSGVSWMDREWSTSALGENQVGWDWFALHFDDATELMIYQLRNNKDEKDIFSSGVFIDKNSHKTKINYDEFELEPLEYFQKQDHKVPIKWKLIIAKLDLELIIKARLPEQMHDFAIPYWEGSVEISQNNNSSVKKGLGYLEMTGY